MQSHLSLQLISLLVKSFLPGQFNHLSILPLNWAIAKLYHLPEGNILRQCLNNYIIHLDLLEFTRSKETIFEVKVHKPSFFMFVLFKGASVLSDQLGNVVSRTTGNSGTLCYLKAGNYSWRLSGGPHLMLCLTFRSDYFLREYKNVPAFKPLVEASLSEKVPYAVLPHCAVAKSILNHLKRLLVKNTAHLKKNVVIEILIDEFMSKYQDSLLMQHYDTHTNNQLKTAEISAFIHRHFNKNDSYNIRLIASRFNISQRKLMRLVKAAFGMPLHDYIVKIRMQRAHTELLTSEISVKRVAMRVGYPDPFHFSRVFKKYHGIAPSEVRDQKE